jgi:hypothetical protein
LVLVLISVNLIRKLLIAWASAHGPFSWALLVVWCSVAVVVFWRFATHPAYRQPR